MSQGVLIVSAVRDDGKREILSVEMADTESESTYNELFSDLKARGLRGVLLIASDNHKGLKAAIKRRFQGALRQRCQVHFTRNAVGEVRREKRKEVAAGLRDIFTAKDENRAKELAALMSKKRQKRNPKLAEMIEEHIEECFSSFSFPASHRPRIRTTNGLERLNQEIKRRTRVVGIFPNRESCLRLVSALCVEQSEEWISGKRYLNRKELNDLEGDQFSTAGDASERDLAVVMQEQGETIFGGKLQNF